ncbi:MAG: competence/damage-inducible protein A [Actinomycetota bacterium]|nr:competence/damage-inducible protein A [Actinomycetota bacterium]
MNAELVAVGTELLLGQIPNTNAQVISQALASIGIDVYFHTVVGDNLERMTDTIANALERADAVIITGGLGPTSDDITREAVTAVTGRRLVRNDAVAGEIRAIFEAMGRQMPEENLKQADLPEGAELIPHEGTAPGFALEHGGALLFALPGVPWEMKAMLQKTVIPRLRGRAGAASIVSREVLVVGLGESATQEKIRDIVDRQTNPTIAYLAGGGQVRVRMSAKAASESQALGLIGPVEEEIRSRLGADAVDGSHASLADALGEMLRERGLKVALAESLTGGLIASQLTRTGGASDFFLGSVVTYATEAKRDVGGVDEAILAGPGPVSEEAAGALAEAARARFGADLGLSATGVAGPSEDDGKPVGTVFVGAAFGDRTEVRPVRGYGDRDNIRMLAATAALDLGRRVLLRPR